MSRDLATHYSDTAETPEGPMGKLHSSHPGKLMFQGNGSVFRVGVLVISRYCNQVPQTREFDRQALIFP